MDIQNRLIDTGRLLETQGLATLGPGKGSCSARDLDTGKIYVTPSGKSFSTVTCDELVEVALDGEVLKGTKPSVDLIFHRAIYAARPEIGAVIHLHCPYATAFAILGQAIPVAMQAIANTVGTAIPVAKFALPGTPELGQNIVQAMQGKTNAVLMANHGLVVCAPTPEECISIASTVETAAHATFVARCMGEPVILTQEQIDGARGFYADKFFKK